MLYVCPLLLHCTEIFIFLKGGCLTVAILLHYFFLAVFSWMLCEAIVLLVAVEFVFYEGFFKSRKFFALLGWGKHLTKCTTRYVCTKLAKQWISVFMQTWLEHV